MKRPLLRIVALVLAAMPVSAPAQTPDYPVRPVRIITDSAPGGAVDVVMRIVAERLSQIWGQPVLAVNQPGGGGGIAARAAAGAAPDGYMLFNPSLSAFVALPGTAANLPIEVPRDFTPIGFMGGAPTLISVAPALGVSTLPELIELAKRRPGELAYGTNGPGRLTHLTGELLQNRAGIRLLMVPYSGGTPQVLNDIMGGRLALLMDGYSGVAGAIQSGKVKPIAVASRERLAALPDVPTAAETIPGFVALGWQALVAPLGTPDAIVQRVSTDLREALNDPQTRHRLAALGREKVVPMSPAEVTAFIHAEQQMWAPIVQQIVHSP